MNESVEAAAGRRCCATREEVDLSDEVDALLHHRLTAKLFPLFDYRYI